MLSRILLAGVVALLAVACDQSGTKTVEKESLTPVVAPPPAPKPDVIEMATPDTPDGNLPAGWSFSTASKEKRINATSGDIAFEVESGASQMTYVIAPEVVGEVTLEYGWEISTGEPNCSAQLVQESNQAGGVPVQGANSLKITKIAGSPGIFSITCRDGGKGFVRKPKLTVLKAEDATGVNAAPVGPAPAPPASSN